jgi:hypothetical protein
LRDNQSDIGTGSALVVSQIGEAPITPGFGTLCFPQNDAGRLADGFVHLLHYVCTKLTVANWINGTTSMT